MAERSAWLDLSVAVLLLVSQAAVLWRIVNDYENLGLVVALGFLYIAVAAPIVLALVKPHAQKGLD